MKKSTLALLMAAFAFGLGTTDVDAKGHHHKKHNHMWHNGKHYHHAGHHGHHHKHRHKKHHIAPLPVVVAHIYIGTQHMCVDVNGVRYGDWIVSTGRTGYYTPQGTYRAIRLERVYFFKKI